VFYFVSTIAESLGWVLPSTLMVPSFMTWKSTRRSMVSSRKAISVISFSGSSWKGYIVSIVILTHVLRDSVPRTSKDGRSALARSQSLGEAPFRCSAASAGPLRRARSPPVWCRILSPDVGGIRSMFVCCGLESGLHNVSTVVWRFLIHQSGSPGSASSPTSQASKPSAPRRSGRSPAYRRIQDIPSAKWFVASRRCGFWARYLSVTSGSPSRIIRCTMIRLLKTMVHVESRRRFVSARKISATPASPACVATRMCSTYFDLGAASCTRISLQSLAGGAF